MMENTFNTGHVVFRAGQIIGEITKRQEKPAHPVLPKRDEHHDIYVAMIMELIKYVDIKILEGDEAVEAKANMMILDERVAELMKQMDNLEREKNPMNAQELAGSASLFKMVGMNPSDYQHLSKDQLDAIVMAQHASNKIIEDMKGGVAEERGEFYETNAEAHEKATKQKHELMNNAFNMETITGAVMEDAKRAKEQQQSGKRLWTEEEVKFMRDSWKSLPEEDKHGIMNNALNKDAFRNNVLEDAERVKGVPDSKTEEKEGKE